MGLLAAPAGLPGRRGLLVEAVDEQEPAGRGVFLTVTNERNADANPLRKVPANQLPAGNDKDQERRTMNDDNTQGGAEPSPASAGSDFRVLSKRCWSAYR